MWRKKWRNLIMEKVINNARLQKIAAAIASVLCAALVVCANTNSCMMIHQPKVPADLARFSKIK